MSIPNYSLFYCCNDLIFFFKSLSDLYLINSRLLRDFFIKSNIIASSHPWFQADKRCVFYRPDSIAWESFRLNSHIRSSVFMTDPRLFNLRIIKNQRIVFKQFFCQRICLFIQFHLMQFLRIRSHFFHIDQTILQFIFSRELQNIICLSFLVLCKTEGRMRSDCEINCLIRRILYFPFYMEYDFFPVCK